MSKPKLITSYEKLDESIIKQIKLFYPTGFEKSLIVFKGNKKGKLMSALPFEGEKFYYMVKMTKEEAQELIIADTDYDSNGHLKSTSKAELAAATK